MARDIRIGAAGRKVKPKPFALPGLRALKPPKPKPPPPRRMSFPGAPRGLPLQPRPPRPVQQAIKKKMVASKRAPIKAPVRAVRGTASTIPPHARTPARKSFSINDRTPAAKARTVVPKRTVSSAAPAQTAATAPEMTLQDLVDQQLSPLYLQNDQEMTAQQQYEQQRTAMIRAMTGELMGKLGQLAPAVSSDYQTFMDRNSAAAKEGAAALAAATTDPQIKADLASIGAPAEQVQQLGDLTQNVFQGGGAVLQNEQGTVPGEAIAREGAAATAYARKLPAIAGLQGNQTLTAFLQDALAQRQKIMDERGVIAAKAPGIMQSIMDSQASQEAKTRALDLEEASLRRQLGNDAFNRKVTNVKLTQSQQNINLSKSRLKLSALEADRNWQATLSRLQISGQAEKRKAAELEIKARGGGFTPSQLAKMKGLSYTIADHAFHGFTETNSKGEVVATHRKLTYGEAVREMLKEGIPIRLATPALNFYYQPNRPKPQATPGSLFGANFP